MLKVYDSNRLNLKDSHRRTTTFKGENFPYVSEITKQITMLAT